MRTKIFGFLLSVSLASPIQAHAQPIAVGEAIQVRVRPERTIDSLWISQAPKAKWITGTFLRVTDGDLMVRVGERRSIETFALEATDVRRATGRDRRFAGAAVGGAVGGAIGALIAYVSFEPEYRAGSIGAGLACAMNNCTLPQSNSRAGETAVGAVGGVSLGILTGYFIGKGVGRWESVELEPAVTPTGAVSMRLRVGR